MFEFLIPSLLEMAFLQTQASKPCPAARISKTHGNDFQIIILIEPWENSIINELFNCVDLKKNHPFVLDPNL